MGGVQEVEWLVRVAWSARCCFFFQAEDGIRDADVTGVQTCALPISREAMSDGKAKHIRASITRPDIQPHWRITIEDNGPGIPKTIVERIFEPFFTTKDTGTGLGLATIHRLIKQHDGRIHVTHSEDLGGARFDIELPVTPQTPTTAQIPATPASLLAGE